jgi:hypothetical protein
MILFLNRYKMNKKKLPVQKPIPLTIFGRAEYNSGFYYGKKKIQNNRLC